MTAAKHAAQRANARRSTGPRTAPGKSRSRWNAVKHGGFASGPAWTADALRALDEDPEEFENLRQGLLASDGPADDPLWTAQIEDLVRLYWRRRRVEEAWIPASHNVESVTGRRWQTPSLQAGPMLLQQLDVLDRAIDRKVRLLVRMRADDDRREREASRASRPPEDFAPSAPAGDLRAPESLSASPPAPDPSGSSPMASDVAPLAIPAADPFPGPKSAERSHHLDENTGAATNPGQPPRLRQTRPGSTPVPVPPRH